MSANCVDNNVLLSPAVYIVPSLLVIGPTKLDSIMILLVARGAKTMARLTYLFFTSALPLVSKS